MFDIPGKSECLHFTYHGMQVDMSISRVGRIACIGLAWFQSLRRRDCIYSLCEQACISIDMRNDARLEAQSYVRGEGFVHVGYVDWLFKTKKEAGEFYHRMYPDHRDINRDSKWVSD
jgi:hypothetical protein